MFRVQLPTAMPLQCLRLAALRSPQALPPITPAGHETTVACKILLASSVTRNERDAEEALEQSRQLMAMLDEEAGLLASLRHPVSLGGSRCGGKEPGPACFEARPCCCTARQQGRPSCPPTPAQNCVSFFAVCHQPPCIVTEFCARGGLDDVLADARRDPAAAAEMTWARRLSLALDAARGMLYLHSRTPAVIHR